MKGGGSPSRHDKLLDKDELKIDLDSFSHHGQFLSCILALKYSNDTVQKCFQILATIALVRRTWAWKTVLHLIAAEVRTSTVTVVHRRIYLVIHLRPWDRDTISVPIQTISYTHR